MGSNQNIDSDQISLSSSSSYKDMTTMMVCKRSDELEPVSFDKIIKRIANLSNDLENVDPIVVAQKVVAGLFHGVKTSQLDDLAAEVAAYMTTIHPEYSALAARISVSNLHKMTSPGIECIFQFLNDKTLAFMKKHKERIESEIMFEKDFEYDFFGYKTLSKSYLLKNLVFIDIYIQVMNKIYIYKQNWLGKENY